MQALDVGEHRSAEDLLAHADRLKDNVAAVLMPYRQHRPLLQTVCSAVYVQRAC